MISYGDEVSGDPVLMLPIPADDARSCLPRGRRGSHAEPSAGPCRGPVAAVGTDRVRDVVMPSCAYQRSIRGVA